MAITRYAIRLVGSDKYLPSGLRPTYVEPISPDNNPHSPRLFATHRDARVALARWLSGEWSSENHALFSVPVAGRYGTKMEIIAFELKEIK